MKLLGIDEAGRGPVIGPMVIVGILINSEDEKTLKELGVKDSKKLTKKRREELYETLKKFPHKTIKISPRTIDSALNNPNMNLNKLELINMIKLLTSFDFDVAYLDCPTANLKAFCYEIISFLNIKNYNISENKKNDACEINVEINKINKKSKDSKINKINKIKIVVANKADDKFLVVSAASIIAKVIRDREIEKIKKEIGVDFGSGYPSDPKTKAFLKENYDRYDIFRRTWRSWKDVKEKEKNKSRSLLRFIDNSKNKD